MKALSYQQKTKVVALIWAKSKHEHTLKSLLQRFNLKKSTYYKELHRLQHPYDKYKTVKHVIMNIFNNEGHGTYGYRRIWSRLLKLGYHYSLETVRKLTGVLNIKVNIYSKHTSKYRSYEGHVGKVSPNRLHQQFNKKIPNQVFHTDVTQIRLVNGKWGYISAMLDEASKRVLVTIDSTPRMPFIFRMIDKLKNRIPKGIHPIIHSDQGWQYQMATYRNKLHKMGFIQSMSRRGNCHDNAPSESFFNLLKRECLNFYKIYNLNELKQITLNYVKWFNHNRISLKTEGLSPIDYQNKMLYNK